MASFLFFAESFFGRPKITPLLRAAARPALVRDLTKSLDVKGSQINARIGTTVKNIKLVPDNTEQIEGKIEGQQIVILTKYVRKTTA